MGQALRHTAVMKKGAETESASPITGLLEAKAPEAPGGGCSGKAGENRLRPGNRSPVTLVTLRTGRVSQTEEPEEPGFSSFRPPPRLDALPHDGEGCVRGRDKIAGTENRLRFLWFSAPARTPPGRTAARLPRPSAEASCRPVAVSGDPSRPLQSEVAFPPQRPTGDSSLSFKRTGHKAKGEALCPLPQNSTRCWEVPSPRTPRRRARAGPGNGDTGLLAFATEELALAEGLVRARPFSQSPHDPGAVRLAYTFVFGNNKNILS